MAEEKETKEVETKEETSSNNGGKKYHLIKENFNKSLFFAIVIAAIITVHTILEYCGIHGNLPWLIINIACTAGLVVFGVLTLVLFLHTTNKKRGEDITSFIISLVAFIVAFVFVFLYGVDAIRNFIGFIRDILNK